MKDKYIIYFISRTKANMIKFIENKLKENVISGNINLTYVIKLYNMYKSPK